MKAMQEGDDDRLRVLEIEFLGGPYDGHKEPCFAQPVHLPADVVWLVCEDVFRLLAGEDYHLGGSITSVALYELEQANGACRYRFAGAISGREFTLLMQET